MAFSFPSTNNSSTRWDSTLALLSSQVRHLATTVSLLRLHLQTVVSVKQKTEFTSLRSDVDEQHSQLQDLVSRYNKHEKELQMLRSLCEQRRGQSRQQESRIEHQCHDLQQRQPVLQEHVGGRGNHSYAHCGDGAGEDQKTTHVPRQKGQEHSRVPHPHPPLRVSVLRCRPY